VPVRLLLLGDLQDPVCSTRNNALDVGQHQKRCQAYGRIPKLGRGRERLAGVARGRSRRECRDGQDRNGLKNSIWEDSIQLVAYRSLGSLAGSYATLSTSTEVRIQREFERKWRDAVRSLPVASEPDRAKLK
jgi:hypothetical protein